MTSNVEHEFFKTSEHSSQVTRLQGFEGYMVTELQNPPHILPYLPSLMGFHAGGPTGWSPQIGGKYISKFSKCPFG